MIAIALVGAANLLASPATAGIFGGLIGFGQESVYCKFHGGGKFRALTTYELDQPEIGSVRTTVRLLAKMAAARNIDSFRIQKAQCGTLFINDVMRSRQCLLIAETAADGAAKAYDRPKPGDIFATQDVLMATEQGTLPLPESRGLMGSQSDCRVSGSGELTIKG